MAEIRGCCSLAGEDGVRRTALGKRTTPYYNIWPIAVELAQSVKLDVPFSDVEPTIEVL